MRAVVTGSAGFIGSHLVERLLEDGATVIGVDTKPVPEHLAKWRPERLRWFECPIQRVPSDFAMFGPHVIYHLASPVGPVGVLEWAGRLVPEVIECAATVRSWALANDCPLVYVSTSEVYGSGTEDRETDDCHFGPETSARKEYAVAKLAAETMLRNSRGLDVRIVRPFNVAGPGQKADGGFVLPRFIEQALAGQPLTVYAPGTQNRSFTHVADLVEGLILAAERGKAGEVYNLGNAANRCSIERLAMEVVDAVLGPQFDYYDTIRHVDPVKLHGPGFREAPEKWPNADKALLALGWHPRRDRATIIADALA